MSEIGEGIADLGRNINQEANRFGRRVGKDLDRNAANVGFTNTQDLLANFLTGGLVGLSAEGELEAGFVAQGVDEAIGEVSGRNARRAELQRQERLLAEETVTRDRLEAEALLADEQSARAASGAADSGRSRSSRGSGRPSSQGGGSFNLGDQRDFLGL